MLAASITWVLNAMKMEATNIFETLVNFYQTSWRNIPADSRLRFKFWLKNLKKKECERTKKYVVG
jgi:hypothetical protein